MSDDLTEDQRRIVRALRARRGITLDTIRPIVPTASPLTEPATAPNVGRCGHHLGRPPFGGISPVCALPAGHAGWHRSDEGTEWGIPAADPYNALLKREKDIYERGVAAGRRQAAEELRAEADNASVIEGGPDLLRWAAEIAAPSTPPESETP